MTYESDVNKVASNYPDTYFLLCSGSPARDNVESFFPDRSTLWYLEGMVARHMTQSNKIGSVGSFPGPLFRYGQVMLFADGNSKKGGLGMVCFAAVDSWIDEQEPVIVDFLCQGVARPSVTGAEKGFQQWFQAQCEDAGFAKVDYWCADAEELRPNVVATYAGDGGGNDLILNGHCDVVPVSEEDREKWLTDPWQGVRKGDLLYGRGTADMKGGLTAMFFAARALQEAGVRLKGNLYLESVVGEELGEHLLGTSATVSRGYTAPFAIVTEGSGLALQVKSSGALNWELTVQGKTAHNSRKHNMVYPQPYGVPCGDEVAVDAFRKLVKLLDAWEELERIWNFRWRDRILNGGGYPGKDNIGVGGFSIVPAIIRAGDYEIAIPGFAYAKGGLYYAPWEDVNDIISELRQALDFVAQNDTWLKKNPPRLNIIYHWPGYAVEPEHPACAVLEQAVTEVTGRQALYNGFPAVNDASFLFAQGIPAITFGPGSLNNHAHGDNEFLSISELLQSIKILARAIAHWCGTVG